MWNRLLDSNYWFTQPSTILGQGDKYLAWFFAACLVLAIIFKVSNRLLANPVNRKLLNKLFNLLLTTSISGLVWFGFRYENTPIFGQRYWAGLVLFIGLVWGLFVLKYLVFAYFKELQAFEREEQKNKYIPKSR